MVGFTRDPAATIRVPARQTDLGVGGRLGWLHREDFVERVRQGLDQRVHRHGRDGGHAAAQVAREAALALARHRDVAKLGALSVHVGGPAAAATTTTHAAAVRCRARPGGAVAQKLAQLGALAVLVLVQQPLSPSNVKNKTKVEGACRHQHGVVPVSAAKVRT